MLRDLGIIISVWRLNMSADHLRMIFFFICNNLQYTVYIYSSRSHNITIPIFQSLYPFWLFSSELQDINAELQDTSSGL